MMGRAITHASTILQSLIKEGKDFLPDECVTLANNGSASASARAPRRAFESVAPGFIRNDPEVNNAQQTESSNNEREKKIRVLLPLSELLAEKATRELSHRDIRIR